MPDQSGYELMRDLVKQYGLKGIALSGYASDKGPGHESSGAFAIHLVKPVTMQALDAAIASLVPATLVS